MRIVRLIPVPTNLAIVHVGHDSLLYSVGSDAGYVATRGVTTNGRYVVRIHHGRGLLAIQQRPGEPRSWWGRLLDRIVPPHWEWP